MDYRLATERDALRLAQLRWEHKDSETPFDGALRDDFISYCANYLTKAFKEGLICWVAEENELIVSTLYIQSVQKIPKPDKASGFWGYVTAVYTVPEYRNKKIGSTLMHKATEWSRARGCELLIVWPGERSVPFYERAGFQRENVVMELLLE